MNHGIKKARFGVGSDYNKALFRNLAKSLITHEQITTTVAKAKAIRPVVEKLVTLAKSNTLSNRRLAVSRLGSNCPEVVKLFSELGVRYAARAGGYLRIMRAGFRQGDKAPMAVIEFVDRDLSAKGRQDLARHAAQAAAHHSDSAEAAAATAG